MIKINLLPQDIKKKEGETKIPLPFIIYIVTVIVLFFHIILGILMVYKKVQVSSLNHSWERMQAQFKEVNVLKNDLTAKRNKVKMMDSILTRDMHLTDFFNKINQAVPKGLWLNRLSFSKNGLVIEGSVFSFGTEEVSLVNKFFNELKNNEFFIKNFLNFNLNSVQRRKIKDYEVLDFLLTAEIANKGKIKQQ